MCCAMHVDVQTASHISSVLLIGEFGACRHSPAVIAILRQPDQHRTIGAGGAGMDMRHLAFDTGGRDAAAHRLVGGHADAAGAAGSGWIGWYFIAALEF